MKILVAEDDESLQDLYRDLFSNLYQVEVVADGSEAFKQIKKKKYDLIITDYNMPGLSGVELVGLIKGASPNRSTPCIVISGNLNDLILERFQYLNVAQVLAKPIDLDTFLGTVQGYADSKSKSAKLNPKILDCLKDCLKKTLQPISESEVSLGEAVRLTKNQKSLYASCMIAIFGREINGSLGLTLSREFVEKVTKNTFPGMEIENLDNHADFVCELSNQVLGHTKRELAKIHLFITLGLPTNFRISEHDLQHFAAGVTMSIPITFDGTEGRAEFCIGKSSYENFSQPDGPVDVFV